MKYIYADSCDYVSPDYDYTNDSFNETRTPYWDDCFPHEMLNTAPYDGMLVSRAIVGDKHATGKYSEPMAMRFRRIGAREHLRLNKPEHSNMPIFGDNGAFSYAKLAQPPYTTADTIEFYGDGQFTHGCSVDHIIFDFDKNNKSLGDLSKENKQRFDMTLSLAAEFITASRDLGDKFTPLGVIQGWSPNSMANAATQLARMGYQYLAVGGLVPLKSSNVHTVLNAIIDAIKQWPSIKLHLLGFAKADTLHEFLQYKQIASFDSTSPLLHAFKSNKNNFYLPDQAGGINYYTAIRIPQAITNNKLKNHAKSGAYRQENLLEMERDALDLVRKYSVHKADLELVLQALLAYSRPLMQAPIITEAQIEKKLEELRQSYERTLTHRPWEKCPCDICARLGIEVIIFRGSNRNKSRGMHNLHVYHEHLKTMIKK